MARTSPKLDKRRANIERNRRNDARAPQKIVRSKNLRLEPVFKKSKNRICRANTIRRAVLGVRKKRKFPDLSYCGSEGGDRTHDQGITVLTTGLCHHPRLRRGVGRFPLDYSRGTPFRDSLYTFREPCKVHGLARRWPDRRSPNSPNFFTPDGYRGVLPTTPTSPYPLLD